MMKMLGLIGYPLGHSFSKKYFEEKFKFQGLESDYTFRNFEITSIDQVLNIVQDNPDLIGFNVTIPYKEQIIPLLDELDSEAKEVGAVNTVKIYRSGNGAKLKGYNTDVFGFEQMLLTRLDGQGKHALVLGTGGASKAIIYVLNKLDIAFKMLSRKGGSDNLCYNQLDEEILKSHQIVINTTPLGMHPNEHEKPDLPYQFIDSRHLFIDLIYNPPKTRFLELAESSGASICNGQKMLEQQAEESWKIYHDQV